MTRDDVRVRLATVLYGDGNDISWPKAVQFADLVLWELSVMYPPKMPPRRPT